MAGLRIPEPYRPVIEKVATLSDEAIQSIMTTLASGPASLAKSELASWVAERVQGVPRADTEQIVEAIASLYTVKHSLGLSAKELASDIADSHVAGKPSDTTPGEMRTRLAERLTTLLNMSGGLEILAKARSVIFDYPNVFAHARILSDVRPVFGKEIDDDIAGAVIVHVLKINYHQAGDHGEFFVALDASDLDQLQSQIERAKNKEAKIQAMLSEADVPHLEPLVSNTE